MRAALLMGLLACACFAQGSFSPPLIGLVRDPAGHVHRVYGLRGVFVLGPPEEIVWSPRPSRARIEGRTLIVGEKRVALPERAGEPQRMGQGWLAAWPFAIRISGDKLEVYRLPAEGPR
jgi:hypothetical protein